MIRISNDDTKPIFLDALAGFGRKEGMIGEVGTARIDLSPSGKVFVQGEIWEAEATEPVAKGEKVKVFAILDTLKVQVRKA